MESAIGDRLQGRESFRWLGGSKRRGGAAKKLCCRSRWGHMPEGLCDRGSFAERIMACHRVSGIRYGGVEAFRTQGVSQCVSQ